MIRANVQLLSATDLFIEKMKTVDLRVCFPEYNGGSDVDKAMAYIEKQFADRLANNHLYAHFTVATDTDNIAQVWQDCRNIVIQRSLMMPANDSSQSEDNAGVLETWPVQTKKTELIHDTLIRKSTLAEDIHRFKRVAKFWIIQRGRQACLSFFSSIESSSFFFFKNKVFLVFIYDCWALRIIFYKLWYEGTRLEVVEILFEFSKTILRRGSGGIGPLSIGSRRWSHGGILQWSQRCRCEKSSHKGLSRCTLPRQSCPWLPGWWMRQTLSTLRMRQDPSLFLLLFILQNIHSLERNCLKTTKKLDNSYQKSNIVSKPPRYKCALYGNKVYIKQLNELFNRISSLWPCKTTILYEHNHWMKSNSNLRRHKDIRTSSIIEVMLRNCNLRRQPTSTPVSCIPEEHMIMTGWFRTSSTNSRASLISSSLTGFQVTPGRQTLSPWCRCNQFSLIWGPQTTYRASWYTLVIDITAYKSNRALLNKIIEPSKFWWEIDDGSELEMLYERIVVDSEGIAAKYALLHDSESHWSSEWRQLFTTNHTALVVRCCCRHHRNDHELNTK